MRVGSYRIIATAKSGIRTSTPIASGHELSLGVLFTGLYRERALEIAARFPQAPTALSSDDFKNGQETPCLRTARTYAILTAPAAGWFSHVR
jgi:hypothetical protein